ncbi:hypothetical protein D3C75_1169710 [compost metagenome]
MQHLMETNNFTKTLGTDAHLFGHFAMQLTFTDSFTLGNVLYTQATIILEDPVEHITKQILISLMMSPSTAQGHSAEVRLHHLHTLGKPPRFLHLQL